MLITRTSPISGVMHSLEVPCTPEQVGAWEAGMLIQDAMPDVEAPLREFIKSGISPAEWRKMFGRLPCSAKCRARRSGRRR